MIIGYNVKKIVAEKKEETFKRLDISSSPKILNVKEREVNLGEKRKVASIEFKFTTEYKPGIGKVEVEGEILYYDKKIKDIIKSWNKNKKLPTNVDIEVKNFLFRKCLTLGINLSQELQLPPPLMFPIVTAKKEEDKKYIG